MAIDPRSVSNYRDNPTVSPRAGEDIDVSSGDQELTVVPTGIFVGTGGILYASLADESSTFRTYKNLANGSVLVGQFHTIRSDTTITDAIALRP